MTEDIADALVGIPIKPIRFAFDGMHEDGHYQRAVMMMIERGFTHNPGFTTYVLYNFNDTPGDLWYRLRESPRLSHDVQLANGHKLRIESFPMRYQPILRSDSRQYIGKHWTGKMLTGFAVIVGAHSATGGTVSCTGIYKSSSAMDEFEYWFGKSASEFIDMLYYPRLRQLLKRKTGHLRQLRAAAQRNKTDGPTSALSK